MPKTNKTNPIVNFMAQIHEWIVDMAWVPDVMRNQELEKVLEAT